MSYNIHGVVEYQDGPIRWDLGEVFFPSTYSDIQEILGLWEAKDSVVPLRGHPTGETSCGYDAAFTGLVIRGEVLSKSDAEFDEYGTFRESDGTVLNEAGAERWLRLGSVWLEDDWTAGGYRRISDPDMSPVNWITADEYQAAIEEAINRGKGPRPTERFATHRAVLAAMRALEWDNVEGVRLVYGRS